mgnify:CR=1 FL=1
MSKKFLVFSEEVAQAQAEGKAIVALESTIIAHGMPYPDNVKTALAVEEIVRQHGAVPATIAILDGKIKIGLSEEEIQFLATSDQVAKVSRRDLPYVVSTGKHGATTVAATMICAQLAGIELFVTGGIGGVHREGEKTMDISADLQELARTNVAVVCAGAKSILDIGLTLEYLETHGVPVIGVQTDSFPAFYARTSGFSVDYRLDTPEEIAKLIRTKWDLGLEGGVVIANPVPASDAMEEKQIEEMIAKALEKAKERNITGKGVTPFLLDQVKELTGGASLKTNIALVKHNARVGAEIAVQLQKKVGSI